MTVVVDASTVVAALVDSGDIGDWALTQLRLGPLVAPNLLPVEVMNVLRRSEQANIIGSDTAATAVDTMAKLSIEYSKLAPVAERVWALRFNLTAYDAFYVAVAEALDTPLATLDKRLTAAPGPMCEFLTPDFI